MGLGALLVEGTDGKHMERKWEIQSAVGTYSSCACQKYVKCYSSGLEPEFLHKMMSPAY